MEIDENGCIDSLKVMEASGSTKMSKSIEVELLDDSCDDSFKTNSSDSSSVKRDIVIRLKSGGYKLSKNVIKNINEGTIKPVENQKKYSVSINFTEDEAIVGDNEPNKYADELDNLNNQLKNINPDSFIKRNTGIRSKNSYDKPSKNTIKSVNKLDECKYVENKKPNFMDFTEVRQISRDNEQDKHMPIEVLNSFGTDNYYQPKSGSISSKRTNLHHLSVNSNNTTANEIQKKEKLDSTANSTENMCIDSTKIETHNRKMDKTNVNILACDYSAYAQENEISLSVGKNICSSPMSNDNVSITTDSSKIIESRRTTSAKATNIVKPLKRYADKYKFRNEPLKKLKKMNHLKRFVKPTIKTQHTNLEFVRDNKQKCTVLPPKQSRIFKPEHRCVFKLPVNEEEDSSLLCETEDQHTKSSSGPQDDKQILQDETSESELPYTILPNGCILDGVVSMRRNIYFCEPCNRVFESFKAIEAHVSGRRHAQNLKDMNKHRVFDPSAKSEDRNERTKVNRSHVFSQEFTVLGDKSCYCKLCNCCISSVSEAQKHAIGKGHIERRDRENWKRKKAGLSQSSMKAETKSLQKLRRIKTASRKIEAGDHKMKKASSVLRNGGITILRNNFYCKVCCCLVSKNKKNLSQHKNGRSHREAFQEYKRRLLASSSLDTLSQKYDIHLKDSKTLHSKNADFEQEEHIGKIKKSSKKQSYHCTLCDFFTNDVKIIMEHMHGRKHKDHILIKKDKERQAYKGNFLRARKKELEMSVHHEEYYRASKRRIKSVEDETGYSERIDETGRRLYYCTICNYRSKLKSVLRDHMHGKRHKEYIHYMEDRSVHHEDHYRTSDLPYEDESCQSREDPSFDSDYQSDLLWNQCYENFMRNIINRDDFTQSSALTDLLTNSSILSSQMIAEQQAFSNNDPSFQSKMEEIQNFQQGPFFDTQPQQSAVSLHPQSEQNSDPCMPALQQLPVPYVTQYQPLQMILPPQPSIHQTEFAEQGQVNEYPNDYLQCCVTSEGDAEIVINIIYKLLHTYLKYKLKELPGSLLKLLCDPSKTEKSFILTNKTTTNRTMEQLLIDLENHKNKFQQTFIPVRDNTIPSFNHSSYINEKAVTARTSLTLSQNKDSSLKDIKKTESSINDIFKQYRNSSNEKRALSNSSQSEPSSSSFSKHYRSSVNDDSSPRRKKPINPFLMNYLNNNSTKKTNNNDDNSQRINEQDQLPTNDLFKHCASYNNEYSSSRNTNKNVLSTATISYQNRDSNHGDNSLQNTNQDGQSFIDLITKYRNSINFSNN